MNNNNFNGSFEGQPAEPEYTGVPYFSEELSEKIAVKSTAQKIGLSLLFFILSQQVLSVLAVFAVSFFAKPQILSDPVFTLAFNIFVTLIGFLGGGLILLKMLKEKNVISFSAPERKTFFPLVAVGVGFCYVANIIVSLLRQNISTVVELKGGDITLPDGAFGFAFSVLSVAVFPALLEEFFFRGAIMGGLMKYGKGFAVFTSALLFGLVHGNLVQMPFAFLVGLILGYAVILSGSVWTSVTIHFINNFLSLVFDFAQKGAGTQIVPLINAVALLIIAVGFFGLYLLCRDNKTLFMLDKPNCKSSSGQRLKWTLSSGFMVVFIVLIALDILGAQIG